jgi:hypothetical protein
VTLRLGASRQHARAMVLECGCEVHIALAMHRVQRGLRGGHAQCRWYPWVTTGSLH